MFYFNNITRQESISLDEFKNNNVQVNVLKELIDYHSKDGVRCNTEYDNEYSII